MKSIRRLLMLLIVKIILVGCSEQHHFTDKNNLNNILNNFTKGDYFTCNLKVTSEELPYKINKNINLIYTKENIGLIYKNDKWGNGNSIYNKKTEGLFELGSSYSEKDYNSQIATKGYGLSFDKKTLKINLFEKNIKNEYSCKQLHEILTEAMKKQLLQNFLLQKNSDRI